jgi:hypothetical protein
MEPIRYFDPPPKGTRPEPGVYTFGLEDDKRKALNFAPGLLSYTKLKRHDDPDARISKFVAGVGNLVSDTLLFGYEAAAGKYHFHHEQVLFNTREGKAWRDQWERENPGVTLIRPKEREEAQRLIEVATANETVKDILNAWGYCEAGVVADLDGLRFRSWLDKLTPRTVVDIKTSRAANEDEFLDGMLKYGYDAQAALYLDQCEAIGLGQLNFAWVVVSKVSNRAWVQELPAWAYWTGRRWRESLTRSMHREEALNQQVKDLLTQETTDADKD